MRGAMLSRGSDFEPTTTDPHDDPSATLILDRVDVSGDVELDRRLHQRGHRSRGERAASAARCRWQMPCWTPCHHPPSAPSRPARGARCTSTAPRSAATSSARGVRIKGQLRMVDTHVRGSITVERATVDNPAADAVLANRCRIGSNFVVRESDVSGGLELRGRHRRREPRPARQPADQARQVPAPAARRSRRSTSAAPRSAATSSAPGARRSSSRTAACGAVARTIGRMANFNGAVLGYKLDSHALNAMGMQVQELMLNVVVAAEGPGDAAAGALHLVGRQRELLERHRFHRPRRLPLRLARLPDRPARRRTGRAAAALAAAGDAAQLPPAPVRPVRRDADARPATRSTPRPC